MDANSRDVDGQIPIKFLPISIVRHLGAFLSSPSPHFSLLSWAAVDRTPTVKPCSLSSRALSSICVFILNWNTLIDCSYSGRTLHKYARDLKANFAAARSISS